MKTDWLKVAIIGYISFLLLGCNSIANPSAVNTTMPSPSITQMATTLPPQGDSTAMNPNSPTPATPGLQNLIKKAKEDLAQRLTISPNQIILVEATEAEWSDSSLGCPQPGIEYLQVITPGFRMVLEVYGTQYEYHSNRDTYILYCENQNLLSSPKP
jgi:hypothetical protein